MLGLRPVLAPSRVTDPPETVRFGEGRMVSVDGGMAAVERDGENYYFVIPLRNVGNGLAVLQAWRFVARRPEIDAPHAEPAEHRPQTRDLYVPAGDTGFWQGAIREPDDPFRERSARGVSGWWSPDRRSALRGPRRRPVDDQPLHPDA